VPKPHCSHARRFFFIDIFIAAVSRWR